MCKPRRSERKSNISTESFELVILPFLNKSFLADKSPKTLKEWSIKLTSELDWHFIDGAGTNTANHFIRRSQNFTIPKFLRKNGGKGASDLFHHLNNEPILLGWKDKVDLLHSSILIPTETRIN